MFCLGENNIARYRSWAIQVYFSASESFEYYFAYYFEYYFTASESFEHYFEYYFTASESFEYYFEYYFTASESFLSIVLFGRK